MKNNKKRKGGTNKTKIKSKIFSKRVDKFKTVCYYINIEIRKDKGEINYEKLCKRIRKSFCKSRL